MDVGLKNYDLPKPDVSRVLFMNFNIYLKYVFNIKKCFFTISCFLHCCLKICLHFCFGTNGSKQIQLILPPYRVFPDNNIRHIGLVIIGGFRHAKLVNVSEVDLTLEFFTHFVSLSCSVTNRHHFIIS